jgi:peptidoglycan/LPS O-acetylase OafA/YrhL
MVLATHLGLYQSGWSDSYFSVHVTPMVDGEAGVNIFFALSGFLISSILLREKLRNGCINFKSFFARRFLRLLPTLLLFYGVVLVFMARGTIHRTYVGLLLSFAYLYNYVTYHFYSGELGSTWSLAVEEQYYAIWPLVIHAASRSRVLVIIALALTASLLVIAVAPHVYLPYHGHAYLLTDLFRRSRWFFPASAPIMLGSGAAVLVLSGTFATFLRSSTCAVVSGVLFGSSLYLPWAQSPYMIFPRAVGVAMFLSWITYHQWHRMTVLLEWAPLTFVGRISYGIYVWQGLFLRTGPGGTAAFQQFPANIILTFAVATISYYTIEKYALTFKGRFK